MPCAGPLCNGCVQQAGGVRYIPPDGTGSNGVLIVADSPWVEEIGAGIPLVGPSGSYLNSILERRHLERHEFRIMNVMNCKPPHLGWTDYPEKYPEAAEARTRCRPYLEQEIATGRYKAIVALGNVALRALTGLDGIESNHGYVCPSNIGLPVIPTFHPSGIIQGNHKLTIAFILAITRALEIADRSYRATPTSLLLDPPLDQLGSYLSKPADFLMCDIETPNSSYLSEDKAEDEDASYTIIRAGFSNAAGTGCSFPFEGAYIRCAQAALEQARVVLFWNKNYDLPRLRAAGFSLRADVVIIDAMWAWHFLQSDLLKALAFAAPFFYSGPPWKHTGPSKPAYYNGMDNLVQTECWLGIRDALQAEGRLDSFMRHCVQCEPILVRMGQRGVRVDLGAREQFKVALQAVVREEFDKIQELVPASLIKYKEWVRQPKDMADVEVTPTGWRRKLGFNPNSSDQVADLIRSFNLKIPRKRGEDRETTEKKYLLRFAGKRPVFSRIVKYKENSKMISTYMWPLNGDMRATTVYGYHPSTLRLSSRKVNLQNIPKRSDLAKQFRKMIIAAPGKVLLEADMSAVEAVLVGYSAGSDAYIRLAKAGIHGWLSSHFIKQPISWELPFAELQAACKSIKRANPVIYEAAKRVIHGSNYMLSPFGIWDEYMELFESQKQVNEIQSLYFSLPPGQDVRKWQERQIAYAHKHKHLNNHFGGRHYFYELFKYDKRSKSTKHGDDAKRAVAYVPQSDAAFMQRELFLDLEQQEPAVLELLELPTHDSIVAELYPAEVDNVARVLYNSMTKCWPQLGGLSIGVELKVGQNLAEQEEIYVTPKVA